MKTGMNFKYSWALYDGCNSIIHLIVITIFLPWFFDIGFSESTNNSLQDWSKLVVISLVIVGLFAIYTSRIIDNEKVRYGLFVICNIIVGLSCFLVAASIIKFNHYTPYLAASLIIFFNICLYIYDSYLVDATAHEKYINKIELSGMGWSIGYITSGAFLLLIWYLYNPENQSTITAANYISWSAILFSGISIILIALWPKPDNTNKKESITLGIKDIILPNTNKKKSISIFLFFAFFIQDGAVTLTYFVTLISKEALNFTLHETIELFLIVHLFGILSTAKLGNMASHATPKTLYASIIALWILSCGTAFFLVTGDIKIEAIYFLCALIGLLIGTTPSLIRATFAQIVPYENRSSYFGFGALFQRTFSFVGPLIVLTAVQTLNNDYKWVCLIIGALFFIPLIILLLSKSLKTTLKELA